MATIEERAAAFTDSKISGKVGKQCIAIGYIHGAQDQDTIARQEERERCIKAAQDVVCRMCESSCREERKYLCSLYSTIRKDIMEGGEG